jgi:hypothetical protein
MVPVVRVTIMKYCTTVSLYFHMVDAVLAAVFCIHVLYYSFISKDTNYLIYLTGTDKRHRRNSRVGMFCSVCTGLSCLVDED